MRAPRPFLVFYGSFSAPPLATFYGYELLILNPPASAQEASNIAALAASGRRVFLYTYLGSIPGKPTLADAELGSAIDAHAALGCGTFLDQYGYDFGTTRAQQRFAVERAHANGQNVVANCWLPADAFGRVPNRYPAENAERLAFNPDRQGCPLGPGDLYMLESFLSTYSGRRPLGGDFGDVDRFLVVRHFAQELGLEVLPLSYPVTGERTADGSPENAQRDLDFLYRACSLLGLEWYSFALPELGASSNAPLPFVPSAQPFAELGPLVRLTKQGGGIARVADGQPWELLRAETGVVV